jgi:hypothetical protein
LNIPFALLRGNLIGKSNFVDFRTPAKLAAEARNGLAVLGAKRRTHAVVDVSNHLDFPFACSSLSATQWHNLRLVSGLGDATGQPAGHCHRPNSSQPKFNFCWVKTRGGSL